MCQKLILIFLNKIFKKQKLLREFLLPNSVFKTLVNLIVASGDASVWHIFQDNLIAFIDAHLSDTSTHKTSAEDGNIFDLVFWCAESVLLTVGVTVEQANQSIWLWCNSQFRESLFYREKKFLIL